MMAHRDAVEQFTEHMNTIAGLEPDEPIVADGLRHRIRDKQDKPGKKDLCYILHPDEPISGWFMHWGKFQDGHNWTLKSETAFTPEERRKWQKQIESDRKQREQEQTERHAECRVKAAKMLEAAHDVNADHPYILKKRITPCSSKQLKDMLLIPVRKGKTLTGLQIIMPDGSKKFLTGTEKAGAYLVIKGTGKTVYLVEGWATGCTVHELTGATVIVCFDCGNLEAVASEIRAKGPDYDMVLVADNDRLTSGNPGLTKARAAALATGARLAIPIFPGDIGTDVNDMAEINGKDAVISCLKAAVGVEAIPTPVTDTGTATVTQGDQWPEPLLFGEIETPEITADSTLPEPLAGFCKAVADSTQTPPGMAVMMALATIATCLQKRFEVCPFGDSYTEPVNIMSIVGAEPATRKSAVTKAMTEPLTIWEMEQAERLKDDITRTRHARDMLIKSIDSIKTTASKQGATDSDRKEALAEIKRLEDSMPPEITSPKLWVDDVNVERLQGLMEANGERIAIISAEGGVFEVLAGLYSGGKSNVNIVLQGHAGEPVRVERQGRSVMMFKPALTFGLMVQPSIISDLAAGNKSRFRGNGLLARLLYCLPKSTVGSRDVTKRRPVPNEISIKYNSLIYKLLAIPPQSDETGRDRPRLLTLAPDALTSWLSFSQYIESKQGQYGEFHNIQDWTGKLPGAALRVAGLCHVVEHGEQTAIISKATIEKALDLAQLLIVHAKAAFDLMGSDPAIPDAKFVLQWIIRNGADSFRRGDLHKATHGKFQRVDRLIAALRVLTERNIISEPQERPTGRRPEIIYTANPSILKGGN
jgi:putative DNA primase/helicase